METLVTLEKITTPYTAAVKAIIVLEERGFTADFAIIDSQIFCSQTKCIFSKEQFEVTAVYRFESEDEQDEGIIIYAIECYDMAKGILLQTIGTNLLNPNNILFPKLTADWLYQ